MFKKYKAKREWRKDWKIRHAKVEESWLKTYREMEAKEIEREKNGWYKPLTPKDLGFPD